MITFRRNWTFVSIIALISPKFQALTVASERALQQDMAAKNPSAFGRCQAGRLAVVW